ncbi:putative mitochondrial carrier protein [Emiliania huxleyi CCMP1516]|uniref:Mitochondrial carrier protein n=2 Tax=Emiliania huxleyi TaxID=2903 RepID=A0A0D3K4N5_EMIH1|nr:putative mitochondrial carrier protein [Emiliania huxleyi CCMP1516]EOD30720.1 putative mitochondrial carrier protein [Emiliania huxleyi CCMP1516]|eukprot:XP_005783149.1 putative mitochondrial carrier protein [Emiliania huxleyi CCMP1516]
MADSGSQSGTSDSGRPWEEEHEAIAGSISGVFSTTLCSPLDVAKTRAQADKRRRVVGVLSALRLIYREEGIRGWYHGLTPSLCSACYFPCYEHAKSAIARGSGASGESPGVHLTAAGLAGLVTDVITNPFWVVRTRLTTQHLSSASPQYHSMTHAIRTIYAEEGGLAFFAGLRASLLGLSHIMIQFPLYERFKLMGAGGRAGGHIRASWRADRRGKQDASGPGVYGSVERGRGSSSSHAPATPALGEVIVASALSKLVASTLTYPHEVQSDGVAGLWHGYRLNIALTAYLQGGDAARRHGEEAGAPPRSVSRHQRSESEGVLTRTRTESR